MGVMVALAAVVLVGASGVPPFPVDAEADYQLGGAYDQPGAVVVVRDRTEPPAHRSAAGFDVCYLNAFQSQPDSLRWWRRHHPRLLLRDAGRLVRDAGWPDEVLLDVSTASRRETLARVVGRWARGCARRGYEAVELDNLDSFTRSHRLLSRADALAAARLITRRAHAHGLAVAQKNLASLPTRRAHRVGFDFAIAEECRRWRECGRYAATYGRRIVEVEYRRRDFEAACADHAGRWSVLLRDHDLLPAGRAGHVRDEC